MARKPKKIEEQGPMPEADRLEGFPHPRETEKLFGHKQQLKQILDSWHSGRMHHAWILSGATGIGKATLAYHIVRIILNHDTNSNQPPSLSSPSADSDVYRQIKALSHPNLLLIRKAYKDGKFTSVITVDEVRRLKSFVGMTGVEGRWRVVILDRADEMNLNAANALLKSLEEPPLNCIFFLITEAIGKIPSTISSRCRKIDFQPLNNEDLRNAVEKVYQSIGQTEKDLSKIHTLSQISGGSVRNTIELLEGKGFETYEKLIKIFQTLPKLDYSEIYDLSEKLAAPAALPDFETFCTLLSDLLRRFIHIGAGSGEAPEEEIHLALRFVKKETLAHWAELWETIAQTKREVLGLNLDRKNFILETFRRINELAQKV